MPFWSKPFNSALAVSQTGRILGSDGEMTVEMANGVAYQIRFGDVAASGSDTGKSAGGDRYLFVTASWDVAMGKNCQIEGAAP